MLSMDGFDYLLLAAVSYMAIVTLVRLMRQRRERLIDELTAQVEVERQRVQAEEERARREQIRQQAQQRGGRRAA